MKGPSAILLAALAGHAALTQSPSAPQQAPTFSTGVDLVLVDVAVLDPNRRPIRGLTAADFTVLEDGKPRPIVQFSPVDLPEPPAPEGQAPWLRAVAPDVVSNDLPRDGRVVVILFDQTIRADGPERGTVKAGPPRDLANAIERAWPATDLRLGLAAVAFADPSADRPFAAITLRSMAGGPRVAALTAAFRQDGSAANSYWQALDLESVLQGVGPHAYDLLTRLPLEPGRYEIRAAVRDERSGKLGTVVTYLNVPDFAREPLSLSGVAFDVVPAPPAEPSATFERTLPVVPSAQRTFSTSDRVRAFLRVYQGRGTLDPVALSVTIDDARGRVVHERRELLPITAFGSDRAAAYSLDLPLESLAPGAYRLRVAATRVQLHMSQDVRFAVE